MTKEHACDLLKLDKALVDPDLNGPAPEFCPPLQESLHERHRLLALAPTDQHHNGVAASGIGWLPHGGGMLWIVKVLWGVSGGVNNPVPGFVAIQAGNCEAEGLAVGIENHVELLACVRVAQGKGQGVGMV
jgi:hypothetical protein